ncbi:hypothetical protein TWF481_003796 [Arthrobotrys musiformis]|uniref:Clr5 domain-containing protein n=1 Tax=Arthrobotrys musiformis TaxID=47236 RepID=A0AAV9WI50_9PEZI
MARVPKVRSRASPSRRQGNSSSTRRGYKKRRDIPDFIQGLIADAISRKTKHEDIVELLRQYGDWIENMNGLKYVLRRNGLSGINLNRVNSALVRKECRRAKREGRQTPEFEYVNRPGERVKGTVIKRLLKKDDESDDVASDEDENTLKIRVVEPIEDIDEGQSFWEADFDADGEVDRSLELLGASGTVTYFNVYQNPAVIMVPFQPPIATNFEHGYSEAIDYPWGLSQLDSQSFLGDGFLPPQPGPCVVPVSQFDSGAGLRERLYFESCRQGDGSGEPDNLKDLVSNWELEFSLARGLVEAEIREGEKLRATKSKVPDGDVRELDYTDSHDVWSSHSMAELNHWVNLARAIALEVLIKIRAEQIVSGVPDIFDCYRRVREKSLPSENYCQFMDWDSSDLPPPHVLLTFFEDPESIPLVIRQFFRKSSVEVDVPTPQERELESQLLRAIFKANFSNVVRASLSHTQGDWNLGLRSMAVHIITIEERFGPDHYFLIRAIFRFATAMEHVEYTSINDKHIIPLLLVLLQKLFRLKLEDSPSEDIPHALKHLYRSLVRIQHFEGARQVLKQFEKYSRKLGAENKELFENKMMMLDGMRLLRTGEKGKFLEYLRQVLRYFTKVSSYTTESGFAHTQGHSIACFDFLELGKCLRLAGSPSEAVSSLNKSIEHCRTPKYQLRSREYDGHFELGVCYETMGLPFLALTYFEDDIQYRKQANIFDTAGPAMKAMNRLMDKCGLSQRVRPTNHIRMILHAYYQGYRKALEERELYDKSRPSEDDSEPVRTLFRLFRLFGSVQLHPLPDLLLQWTL